ncbi:C40 family peptidase [Pelosinus propionicus]|uniref:NlpC/P60 domain-containing protein n=1 Tax=Pelosinus propionicus DSM 13327 TaxID=1123291 RepID=A0A1I4N0I4_9FIRM|nr:hydrolase [Pelosinus propionicus]SFM09031.1 hypothetical protein SAMN04490355_104012 [Pelosinus propionicus DSM 13327]
MNNIVEIAKTYLNTPYHSGAKIKGVGIDCGQLLIAVYEEAGLLKDGECDPGQYSNEWHLHRSEEKYLGWVEKFCDVVTGDPQPGDIATFKFGRCVSHGGIVVEWSTIIHSYVGMGVILSDIREALLQDNKGKSRLYAVYRHRRVV